MDALPSLAESGVGLGMGLAALRWWALLAVQVVWRRTVGPVWLVVAAGLALGLATARPGIAPDVVLDVEPTSAAAAELLLGALVGLVVALPGHALVGAADASARVLGTGPGPWRALTLCLVGATALSLGLHQPLLQGASGIFEAWPVGEPSAWVTTASAVPVARVAHGTAVLALTLATPALLAGAVAELVVAVAGQGSTVSTAMAAGASRWLRASAALVATGASWAAYDGIWAERALGS